MVAAWKARIARRQARGLVLVEKRRCAAEAKGIAEGKAALEARERRAQEEKDRAAELARAEAEAEERRRHDREVWEAARASERARRPDLLRAILDAMACDIFPSGRN